MTAFMLMKTFLEGIIILQGGECSDWQYRIGNLPE